MRNDPFNRFNKRFDGFVIFHALVIVGIVIFGIFLVFAAVWEANLAVQCANTGDPNSKECFRYSVLAGHVTNNNVNLNVKHGE